MSYDNIPAELKALPQWLVWKLVEREGQKPTKIPINATTGFPADVTNSSDYSTFEVAVANAHRVSGIGFAFTKNDKFTGIDLDETHGDTSAHETQQKIFMAMDSYSELSPSGTGLHIIVEANFEGCGRRRGSIEMYCADRFFTMTGNVYNNKPIAARQSLVDMLYDEMGGPPVEYTVHDEPQEFSDEEIIAKAFNAANGDKFNKLNNGEWQSNYTSQSEADFAYVDIIAYYTKNSEQIRRIFRASALGQTPKDNYAHRGDRVKYVEYMVRKSYDRQLPKLDVDGLAIKAIEEFRAASNVVASPAALATGTDSGPEGIEQLEPHSQTNKPFPPGLLGEVAQYIYDASPRPVWEASLTGAIGFLSGITGRGYQTYTGAGLNQYILLLAPTGTGKDAITNAVSKLINACTNIRDAKNFIGPGELVSSSGLMRWLEKNPCVLSILGEVGLMMQQMAAPTANAHLKGLQRLLTQLYSKSSYGAVLDAAAYSDQAKNIDPIHSPSLTILGESVPEEFYDYLDDNIIKNGLLPRFTIFEYEGRRPYYHEASSQVTPSIYLINKVQDLMSQSLNLMHNGKAHYVPVTNEAKELFDNFDRWTTDEINNSDKSEVVKHLWNRAHLKAIKLASIWAIGIHYLEPLVTLDIAQWATDLIVEQTKKLVAKFESGLVGSALNGSDEMKQINEVINVIGRYCFVEEWGKSQIFGGTEQMYKDKVISNTHIQRRLVSMACFRKDRLGATAAIKRAIQHLLDGDEIREMPTAQMLEKYGNKGRSFVIANSKRFVAAVRE